jgi:prephenate dehydrogenase
LSARSQIVSSPIRNIAVIGAAGRMGRWFTYHFAKRGTANIFVFDTNKISPKISKKVRECESIQTCVQDADLVIVCVPIESVVPVVRKCLASMKRRRAILCEISSLKKNIFKVLRSARKDVRCLCIHPMFGPAINRSRKMKFLLIPVINQGREVGLLKTMFPGSGVEVIRTPELHDQNMAVVIGLTYYVNMVLGLVISKLDLKILKRVAGTTFGMQAMITESVLNDSPELVASILRENPFNMRYMMDFLTEANNVTRLVSSEQEDALKKVVENLKIRMNTMTSTNKSYLNFYKAIEYIKKSENRE